MDKTKICTKCKKELPNTIEYFYIRNTKPDGSISLKSSCRECKKLQGRLYHHKTYIPQIQPIKKNYTKKLEALPKDFYNSIQWKNMRIEIFKRDNFKCKIQSNICTEVGTIIHHINSAYYYPSLSLKPKNLITSCYRCHELTKNK